MQSNLHSVFFDCSASANHDRTVGTRGSTFSRDFQTARYSGTFVVAPHCASSRVLQPLALSSSFLLFFCKNYPSHHLGCSGKTSAFSHTLSWPAIAMAMSSHHRNAGLPSWTRPQFGRAPQRVALDPITQRSDRNGDGASASQQPGTPPQQVTIKFLQDQVSLLSSTPSRARSTLDLFSTGPFLSLAEVCEHCPSG